MPDIEFVIQTGDNGIPHGAPWALGRKEKEEELTLMPGESVGPRFAAVLRSAVWLPGQGVDLRLFTRHTDYSFFSWVRLSSTPFPLELALTHAPALLQPEPHVDSWQEVADHTLAYETKLRWEDKIDKLLWRGAFLVDIRKELWEIAHRHKWGAFLACAIAAVGRVLTPCLSAPLPLPCLNMSPGRPLARS